MIRKLRIKFIALSMLSLFLVLFLIMGTVNLLNYRDILTTADETLALLSENNGRFPMSNNMPRPNNSPRPHNMSPELPYESRYFSVLLKENGQIASVDTGKIAAIDSRTAIDYAQEIYQSGRTKGFLSTYRYLCVAEENGTRIIFLDCGRALSTFYSFLWASCAISLFGLLAVFLLMLLFSGRIIKPVSVSYEKQKQFITDAGHELKTPISIISADAEVLGLELGENEWLQDIRRQTERLSALTGELICLSRMEEQAPLQMLAFPFSDMVEETAHSFFAPAKQQNKTLTLSVEPMLSLCGDEKALTQLVTILLDNALKYSDYGGQITLCLSHNGRSVRLTVENSSDPIDAAQLPQLFDRFYRADRSRSSQTGGYGIGLSIARAIVQAHKGKITASSRDGHSVLITVTLPR